MEDLEYLALAQLDDMLSRPVYQSLSSVTFVLADFLDRNPGDIFRTFATLLPHTTSRRLLVVQ